MGLRRPGRLRGRFRSAAAAAPAREALVLTTQVARALGLQERYDDAHELLDTLPTDDPEVATRVLLERGRLHRSGGAPDEARPLFGAAAESARTAGLDVLHVDALHMTALVAPVEQQLGLHHHALAVATVSADPAARDWDASLLNNIGMTHADAGDWGAALAAFEDAVLARERIGDAGRLRIARWMVGWSLRHLGHADGALEVQRGLRAELDAAGEDDPYVDEEIALLLADVADTDRDVIG
ncbi:tetratricopeptide repeat protein [Nocardioides sp.]|uniref:tetratricopeptide repeat protein n=1 Tax=Nocardioides sp. TaxID=35761 RepID=UPI00271D4D43|nr:tetratricopeptide repeat protein [Nocardioides sp.]MDO9456830.1 tetratricopeptide repeat protein [Nocardioides sp.]